MVDSERIFRLRADCSAAARVLSDDLLRQRATAVRRVHFDTPMGDQRTELTVEVAAYEEELSRRSVEMQRTVGRIAGSLT